MLIYFDIDSTVFTTHLFKQTRITPHMAELLGVRVETLLEVEKDYFRNLEKSTDFKYQDYCSFMAEAFVTVGGVASTSKLIELFETPALYEGMVYPDVIPTLQMLTDRGDTLGIYSEGFSDFQGHKITDTGLLPFFSSTHIHIARRKSEEQVLSQLESGSLLIDDKIEYLQALPEGITGLLIVRDPEKKAVDSGFEVVSSLEEIARFL